MNHLHTLCRRIAGFALSVALACGAWPAAAQTASDFPRGNGPTDPFIQCRPNSSFETRIS
jgi:hypothetical protein